MALFSSNPLMFRIKYVNGDRIETTTNASAVLGNAFHNAIDMFFRTQEGDPLQMALTSGMNFIEEYPEGFIKWGKIIPDRQTLKDKFVLMFNVRVKELRKDEKVMGTELPLTHKIDVEWNGKRVALPIPLKGIMDRVSRDEKGRIVITDEKSCYSFSDPEKIDGKKILQAIQYYFLVYAEFAEEPYKMRFVETKHSGKDDADRTRAYDVIYAENELFFDFYLRFYHDTVRALMGEQVYLPNVETLYDNEVSMIAYTQRLDVPEEKAKQEKKLKVDNITDILKKKVASMKNMNALKKTLDRSLVEYKNIDYSKMQEHEKIATKFMEYGIILHYDSAVAGGAFTQYRYTPSIGVKMTRLASYASDIEQTLGISGIRVIAPIPDTSYIGIEVPNKKRTFVRMGSVGSADEGVPIGIDLGGETLRITLDDMPHMLVAGSTGSGKSVFLNSVIESIQHQYSGANLYLIDTKMVELSRFAENAVGIAYTADEARMTLAHLVEIMDARYKVMLKKKVRHHAAAGMEKIICVIDEFADIIITEKYNAQKRKKIDSIKNVAVREEILQKTRAYAKAGMKIKLDLNDEDVAVERTVEDLLVLLAQKGRAAGIHLIIATQRPDKDIITGLIKANFPTKVAFATVSEINSKIILGEAGAEKLLGKGDGLIYNPKFNGIKRFQGFNA